MGLLPQAARLIGRTADYLTPGAGTNRLTTFGRDLQSAQNYTAANGGGGPAYNPNAPITKIGGGGGQVLGVSAESGPLVADPSGAAADAAEREAALYGIEAGISSARDAEGRLINQERIGMDNINRDFQDAWGRIIGQRKRAEAEFGQNKTTQLNEYQGARNQAGATARNWLESARRTAGSAGAGGGSFARYVVPNEAQQIAAEGNAAAQSTNNRNIVALEQNWDRTDDELTNSSNDVLRQKEQGENDLKSRIGGSRAELLATIGSLMGQKSLANGGNWKQAQAEAAPYTSKIGAILDSVDSLSATPAIRERQVTVDRPDLAGYDFAQPDAPVVAQQDPTLNPIWARLIGRQPTDEQLQYA